MRWFWALPAAAVAGLCLDLASPSAGIWPLSFLGAGLLLASVWQQRLGFAALLGAIAGFAFWLPLLNWLTLYLGPVPWLGLGVVMSAWFALMGFAIALATRGIARLLRFPAPRMIAQAAAVAGIWILREQLQGSVPYGGFPWGRLAHMQAEGPLSAAVSWIGFTGLSATVAFLPALVVAAIFASPRFEFRRYAAAVAASVLAFLMLGIVPVAAQHEDGTLRVAAVQGNSKSGIFDDRENGDVFRSHLEATEELLDDLERAEESVDIIVWPENSAEFGLPENASRVLAIERLSRRANAPIVLGTILENPDGTFSNSSVVFDASGDTGLRYDKRRPVPFAEYMPDRDFFHALAPDLVDLVQLEYSAGALPAVMEIPLQRDLDPVRAGIAICFDIIFDEHALDMSEGGAQIILAQSNNADFGRTDESAQQLAIARLRAVEAGRTLVNISTVGTSAIVAPDGGTIEALPTHTSGALVAEVPLRSGQTPALRYGAIIATLWSAVGLSGTAAGIAGTIRARRDERRG